MDGLLTARHQKACPSKTSKKYTVLVTIPYYHSVLTGKAPQFNLQFIAKHHGVNATPLQWRQTGPRWLWGKDNYVMLEQGYLLQNYNGWGCHSPDQELQ